MSLIAWYPFKKPNADDASGNGFHGSASGGKYVAPMANTSGKAWDNEGNSSVTVPYAAGLYPGDEMSVAFWVDFQTLVTAATVHIVAMYDSLNSKRQWTLYFPAGSSQPMKLGTSADGTTTGYTVLSVARQVGRHHVVATCNNTTKEWKIYVDGVLAGGCTASYSYANQNSHLTICGLTGGSYENAIVDDVRLYDEILTIEKIVRLASGVGTEENLDGRFGDCHYMMEDEAASTTVVDSGPNALDATASANTSGLSVEAKLCDGLDLDATYFVSLPDAVSVGLGGASGATVIVWLKRTASGDYMGLFNINVNGDDSKVFLRFEDDFKLYAGARSAAGDSLQAITSSQSYTDSVNYHMIAATFDLPNATIKLYYDGALIDTQGSLTFGQTTFTADNGNAGTLGASTAAGGELLDGILDDVIFEGRIWTAGMIKRLFDHLNAAEYNTGKTIEDLYAENNGPLRPVLRS